MEIGIGVEKFEPWDLKRQLSLRRELRLALLAAMETCWVYSILAFLAALMKIPRAPSPLTLFFAYWIALLAGRGLPRLKQRWSILQLIAVGLAAITLFSVARIELYPRLDLFDFSWLPRFVRALSFADGFVAEHLTGLGVLFVFMRGLGYGQRPLTLWFIGFQFRLGVVIFFLLLIVSSFLKSIDVSFWIFVYFFFSLLAIALARLDEIGSDIHYGLRWAMTLLTGVALVVFLGLGLLQFFTLDVAEGLLRLFTPLWILFEIILLIIIIPVSLIVGFLVDLLQPLFINLRKIFDDLQRIFPPDTAEKLAQAAQPNPALGFLIPLGKTILILGVFLSVGYLLARALNRRMQESEAEAGFREALGEDEEAARVRRAAMTKKKSRRQHVGPMAAESIRRIYAALVARASVAGLPRQIAETPYEFLPRLQRRWSENVEEMRTITDAYVAVHYAEEDATPDQVQRVRTAWQRIEKVIRETKQKE